jgi:hypothetical protein
MLQKWEQAPRCGSNEEEEEEDNMRKMIMRRFNS